MVSAKEKAAVVITTPQSIKSLQLNFVEAISIATERTNVRYTDQELRG